MQVNVKIQALYMRKQHMIAGTETETASFSIDMHIYFYSETLKIFMSYEKFISKMFWRQNEQGSRQWNFHFLFQQVTAQSQNHAKQKTIPNISKVERILDIWVVTALWMYLFLSCNSL